MMRASIKDEWSPVVKLMKEICVVHLIRAHNGIEPFVQFLDSYKKNKGGIDHDLLIVFKGFENSHDKMEYERLLAGYIKCTWYPTRAKR